MCTINFYKTVHNLLLNKILLINGPLLSLFSFKSLTIKKVLSIPFLQDEISKTSKELFQMLTKTSRIAIWVNNFTENQILKS